MERKNDCFDTVLVWMLDRLFMGHSFIVTDISWSYDSKSLATSSFDYSIILWNLSGQRLTRIEENDKYFRGVKISNDNNLLIGFSSGRNLFIYKKRTNKL